MQIHMLAWGEAFAEGSCFGSCINLPKQENDWRESQCLAKQESGEGDVSVPHLSSGDSEGTEALTRSIRKGPTCLLGNFVGFSIGVGTTRLAASGLE